MYSGACPALFSGNCCQFANKLGMKANIISQRNPRFGFCVPTNQIARIALVQAAKSGTKKPRANSPMIAQPAICSQRFV